MIAPDSPDFPAFTQAANAALSFWAAVHLADTQGAPVGDCLNLSRKQLDCAREALADIEDPRHREVVELAIGGMTSALQMAEQVVEAASSAQQAEHDAQCVLPAQSINSIH